MARSGTTFRTMFTNASTDLNSMIVLGVGKYIVASTRSSPLRIPSAVSTCPKYLTNRGPNCTFDGFRVRPAACSALNMFSGSCRWPAHVADQHIQSSMYTKTHSLGQSVRKLVTLFARRERVRSGRHVFVLMGSNPSAGSGSR